MYIVKLTTKVKGKTVKEITSQEFLSFEKANELLETTLQKATNFINIKFLGTGKVKIIKANEENILEIIEKN